MLGPSCFWIPPLHRLSLGIVRLKDPTQCGTCSHEIGHHAVDVAMIKIGRGNHTVPWCADDRLGAPLWGIMHARAHEPKLPDKSETSLDPLPFKLSSLGDSVRF